MDFTFKGFNPGLPLGIYILILILSVALAWWSYRDYKTISAMSRYVLIALRSMVFTILLLLLMNPLFQTESVNTVPPNISVYLDNSQSISIEKGRYEGTESYRQVLSRLNFSDKPETNISYYAIGKDLTVASSETLSYEATETNLSAAVEHLNQNESDIDAGIMLTDGIYTTGTDPSYPVSNLNTPLFVIGLGDTVNVQDLVIKNVVTSNKGFTRTQHPVETTIINEGFSGKTVTVQLLSGDRIIASKSYVPDNIKSAKTLEFSLPLREEGLQQFRIRVPEKKGEWTAANNEQSFSIDVRDNRDRVLHLAFEIHPDVKSLRSLLRTDQNISLASRTWLGGERFIGGSIPNSADTLDLMILHGYPAAETPAALDHKIATISDRLPVLFIRTPSTQYSALPEKMRNLLPITSASSTNSHPTGLYPVANQTAHPVMDLPEISIDNIPRIWAPIQENQLSAGSSPLFKISYQGNQTDVPFIAIKQLGNQRSSIINGFGFYKLRQYPDVQSREFITELLFNLVTWTAAETDDQLLRVEPSQRVFDGNDRVQLNAFLRNESEERESDATVDITLNGEEGFPQKQYTMKNQGEGKYTLNLGTLAEGIYQFDATATKQGSTLDTYEGEFSVSPTRIEFVNTTRNDQFLQQIAGQTGGKFYDFSNVNTVWKDLSDADVLQQNTIRETSTYYPYRHIFWFIAVVFLLGIEWLLRKYYALP